MRKYYTVLALLTFTMWMQMVPFYGTASIAKAEGSIAGSEASAGHSSLAGPSYPVAQDSYFTDDAGNILMYLNVLGQVAKPGQIIVRENADFATILALSGGIIKDTNLRKVLVIRHEPDDDGKQVYMVNLKPFYKNGDRSGFIVFKPNDTIIFSEKGITAEKLLQYVSMVSPLYYMYDVMNRNNN